MQYTCKPFKAAFIALYREAVARNLQGSKPQLNKSAGLCFAHFRAVRSIFCGSMLGGRRKKPRRLENSVKGVRWLLYYSLPTAAMSWLVLVPSGDGNFHRSGVQSGYHAIFSRNAMLSSKMNIMYLFRRPARSSDRSSDRRAYCLQTRRDIPCISFLQTTYNDGSRC